MAEYIITRASIINRCNHDGRLHLQFTEAERPCREAYLKELRDENGILCSRYCIRLASIEEVDRLGSIYDANVMITRNLGFPDRIALVMLNVSSLYCTMRNWNTHNRKNAL